MNLNDHLYGKMQWKLSGIKAITAKSESLLFDEFVAAMCMVKNPEKELQFLKNSHHPKNFEIRAKRESATENIL